MTLKVYGLKNCDTCKKALKALEGHHLTFIDIRNEADLADRVPVWLHAVGAETLINKRSTTWRNLSDKEKETAVNGDPVPLLESHPTLIKRPVIEQDEDVYVGWTADTAKALGVN